MKKIFIAIAAISAMTFASCGGSTTAGSDTDSLALDEDSIEVPVIEEEGVQAAQVEAEALISEMASQVESGNASTIATKMAEAEAYISKLAQEGKTEAVKAYVAKLKEFAEQNQDKLSELKVNGAESVSSLLSTVTSLSAENQEAIQQAADQLKEAYGDKAEDLKSAAKDKADELKQAAKDKANEAVENAKSKAAEEAKKAGEDAKKKVDDAINDAKSKLGF